MDKETKEALDSLQGAVSELVKGVNASKESSNEQMEKLSGAVEAVEKKQDAFETAKKDATTRKGAFADDIMDGAMAGSQFKATGNLNSLIQMKTMDEGIVELQKANDDIMVVSQVLGINPNETKLYNNLMKSNHYLKAMDTQEAGGGAEWVPVGYSPRLFDLVRLELKVAALFENITMPTAEYKPPVVTSDPTGYLVPENTAADAGLTAGNRVPASKPGTGNFTLSAKKIAGRVVFSEELSEDSIVPVLPLVNRSIVQGIGNAIETAVINGDTGVTHQDSDVTDAKDARKAWDGLRKSTETGAKVSLATFNADTLLGLRTAMGKYGIMPSQLAIITSIAGYMKLVNIRDSAGNQMVTTLDKYGPSATIISGELGKIWGVPIIVSEFQRDDLNATGVHDGTTVDKTVMNVVYRAGFLMGDRRTLKVKTAEDINTDQTILVATTRRAFSRIYTGASEKIVSTGFNIATT